MTRDQLLDTLRRIREAHCPACNSQHHHAVDPDGAGGEYLRHCNDCGRNFMVAR
jgi:transcription elongation factor Elf1